MSFLRWEFNASLEGILFERIYPIFIKIDCLNTLKSLKVNLFNQMLQSTLLNFLIKILFNSKIIMKVESHKLMFENSQLNQQSISNNKLLQETMIRYTEDKITSFKKIKVCKQIILLSNVLSKWLKSMKIRKMNQVILKKSSLKFN